MTDENLIFIISQPRSGSTLLQAILSNHPKVDTVSEHWMALKFISLLRSDLISAKYDRYLCEKGFIDFLDKIDKKRVFEQDIKNLMLKYYSFIQSDINNFVLDKTPRYYEIFDTLYEIFTNSKFIVLIRNPIDVFRSIIETWKMDSINELSRFYKRDIFQAPFLLNNIKKKYSNDNRVMIVRFEDLIQKTESTICDLAHFINIEYDDRMLNYSDNKKYLGLFGDKVNVNKLGKVSSKEQLEKYIESKRLKKYLHGYSHFLGDIFLEEYGGYDKPIFNKKTKVFSLLQFFSNKLFFPSRNASEFYFILSNPYSFSFLIRYAYIKVFVRNLLKKNN